MKWYLKLITIYMVNFVLRVLYIFPIKKNRILFSANGGSSYKCNPQYIFEALYKKHGKNLEYIWSIQAKNLIPSYFDVKTVTPLSLSHLFYLMTSKVIISNVGIEPIAPPRKGRFFINTWHGGGAYKKGGLAATYYSKPHRYYFKKIRNLRAKATSYLISSNKRFSEIFQNEFRLKKDQILPIGMPRNDIFFYSESTKRSIRDKICKMYGINPDSLIILYAPTYRGHEANCEHIDWTIDTERVCEAVKNRFDKEPVILYRCHMNVANDKQILSNSIDASDYPDMQELLLATDLLISDYSSLIWDYSFTYRPGFLYTPDLDEYCKVTKLHTPINLWQYPYSKTMEELIRQIENYDEGKAKNKIKKHHELLGSFENGSATEYVCNLIDSKIL